MADMLAKPARIQLHDHPRARVRAKHGRMGSSPVARGEAMGLQLNCMSGMGTGHGDIVMASLLPDVEFYATGKKAELLSLFVDKERITDDPTDAQTLEPCWALDIEQGRERGRLELWCEALGHEPRWRRPTPRIPQRSLSWASGQIKPNSVCIFPLANQRCRQWPSACWIDLAWKLKEQDFNRMVLLPKKIGDFRNVPQFFYGYSWADVAALCSLADVVIGNDSCGVHLGATLGTRTIALLGPTTLNVFTHAADVVETLTSDITCTGCHFRNEYRAACDVGCQSLFRLSVEDVMRRVSGGLKILPVV